MQGRPRQPFVLLRVVDLDGGELVVAVAAADGVDTTVDHGQVEAATGGPHRADGADLVGGGVVDLRVTKALTAVVPACNSRSKSSYISTRDYNS